MQQSSGDLEQRGLHSSPTVSEVGHCNWIYDRSCSHCFVLQELFDNFDHHSSVDIMNSEVKTQENASHLEIFLLHFERNCGWLFGSILSCFAVQVSITLLQLTYSWSQQVILVLNDLFIGDVSMDELKRTRNRMGNLEVV